MKIVCDACSAKYSIADDKVRGKVFKIRCKKCSNIIVVRGTAEADQPAGFDQKETHVFDYPNQDGEHGPTVDGAPDEEVWYLVIDGEQSGPMSAAQVRDRFARGDIDADTYVWREGFADWDRLGSTADFRDLDSMGEEATVGGAAPGADDAAAAGMFGGPAVDAPAAAESDPNDLFAAQSGVGAPAGAASPAPAAASGAAADDLFGAPAANGSAAEPSQQQAPAQIQSTLTGQRNENSVLFSLNNLASLAGGDSPGKAAAPSPSPSPSAGSASSATEGSGLIDIRSMASVYLGEQQGGAADKDKGDDIPVFGGGGFESASPVLLPPTQTAQANNKLLYTLIGVIGALVVAATVLVLIVVKNMGSSPDPQLAAAPVADEAADTQAASDDGDDGDEPAADDDESGSDDSAAAAAAEEPDEPEPEADEPEKEPEERADRSSSRQQQTAAQRRQQQREQRQKRQQRQRQQQQKSDSSSSGGSSSSSSGGGDCDEVSCLVDPNRACCAKYKQQSGGGGGGGGGGGSDKPARLSQSDVRQAMGQVRGRVSRCGDQHNISGTVQVRVQVAPNGSVRSATANGVSGGGKSCIEGAVKRARFKETQRGMTFNYPFAFR